jgi:hypothetical protein
MNISASFTQNLHATTPLGMICLTLPPVFWNRKGIQVLFQFVRKGYLAIQDFGNLWTLKRRYLGSLLELRNKKYTQYVSGTITLFTELFLRCPTIMLFRAFFAADLVGE